MNDSFDKHDARIRAKAEGWVAGTLAPVAPTSLSVELQPHWAGAAADVLRLAHAWAYRDDWNVLSIYVSTLDELVARAVAGESIDSLVHEDTL